MMLSGQKGYYEDYLRKQSGDTKARETPALLSDRTAYVNFLETQLERVSAACLSVSTYDQKFKDMQTLIVDMEERTATNTKLIGMAQQCTEEVRNELDTKINSLVENMKEENRLIKNSINSNKSSINACELQLGTLSVLPNQLHHAEQRITECENQARQVALETIEERSAVNGRLDILEEDVQQHKVNLESIGQSLIRQRTEMEHIERKATDNLENLETRLKDMAQRDKESLHKSIEHVSDMNSKNIDEVKGNMNQLETSTTKQLTDMNTSMKDRNEKLYRDLTAIQKKYEETVNSSMTKFKTDTHEELDEMHTQVKTLETNIEKVSQDSYNEFVNLHNELEAAENNWSKENSITHSIAQRALNGVEKINPVLKALAEQHQAHLQALTKLEFKVNNVSRTVQGVEQREAQFEEKTAQMLNQERMQRAAYEKRQGEVDAYFQSELKQESNMISQERAERMKNEQYLQSEINAEANMINQERNERMKNEQYLQSEINAEANLINQERNERMKNEQYLQSEIVQESNMINSEHAERMKNEQYLQSEINAEANMINQERSERMKNEQYLSQQRTEFAIQYQPSSKHAAAHLQQQLATSMQHDDHSVGSIGKELASNNVVGKALDAFLHEYSKDQQALEEKLVHLSKKENHPYGQEGIFSGSSGDAIDKLKYYGKSSQVEKGKGRGERKPYFNARVGGRGATSQSASPPRSRHLGRGQFRASSYYAPKPSTIDPTYGKPQGIIRRNTPRYARRHQGRSVSVMSPREQKARDNERSYYLTEKEKEVLFQAAVNPEVVKASSTSVHGVSLNQSLQSSISAISETALDITQDSATTGLTPYFSKMALKRNASRYKDPSSVGAVTYQTDKNKHLWLPNKTSRGGGKDAVTLREAMIERRSASPVKRETRGRGSSGGNGSSEVRMSREGASESKSDRDREVSGIHGTVNMLMRNLERRERIAERESQSKDPSESTSTATVEALAERPHRSVIAPPDNLSGSSARVVKNKK